MTLRERIDSNPLFFVFSLVAVSFGAGFGSLTAIQSAMGLEALRASDFIAIEEVKREYVSKGVLKDTYIPLAVVKAEYLPKSEAILRSECESLLKEECSSLRTSSALTAGSVEENGVTELEGEAQQFKVTLFGCYRSGSSAICDLAVTNLAKPRKFELLAHSWFSANSRAIDNSGQEYQALSATIGSRQGSQPIINLPQNVPVRASLTFDGIEDHATSFSLLQVGFRYIIDGYQVDFHDVPLRRRDE